MNQPYPVLSNHVLFRPTESRRSTLTESELIFRVRGTTGTFWAAVTSPIPSRFANRDCSEPIVKEGTVLLKDRSTSKTSSYFIVLVNGPSVTVIAGSPPILVNDLPTLLVNLRLGKLLPGRSSK